MAFKIKLSSGSVSGHVVPVDLDVAYGTDPQRRGTPTPVTADLHLFFDENVLELVPGSLDPGGSYSTGSGVISWNGQSIGSELSQYCAAFQWIDFHSESTKVNATANLVDNGVESATPLELTRPDPVEGLKIRGE